MLNCCHFVHMPLCLVSFLCTSYCLVSSILPFPVFQHLPICIARSRLGGAPYLPSLSQFWFGPDTLWAHISTCHFQRHVAGCVAAIQFHCPFMLRVCCCHPHLLHCWVCPATPFIAQGVSLPPSLVALRGSCCHPHTVTHRVCCCHPSLR